MTLLELITASTIIIVLVLIYTNLKDNDDED